MLLESPTERVMDIIESFPGAYALVPQDGGAPDKEYWLYHGQAIPKTNDTPPWPQTGIALGQGGAEAARSTSTRSIRTPTATRRCGIARGRTRPRPVERTGSPRERGRTPKHLGWKSIRLEGVPTYPHRINPLSLLPDGRLYGTGDDYVGTFIFDPQTDQTTILGPRPGLAPYTHDRLRRQALFQRLFRRPSLRLRSRTALDAGQGRTSRPSRAQPGRRAEQSPVPGRL